MELVEELNEKRERHNAEAEKHRHHRDRLNEQTREWVHKRDDLNAQARDLIDQASAHKARRNELNQEVRDIKVQRDLWNRKVNETAEALAKKKREKEPPKGEPIRVLKKRLKEMEFQQQTSNLNPAKEKELIDRMRQLDAEIKSKEKEMEGDEEIKRLQDDASEAREKAEFYHAKVEELAVQSQKEHDTMMGLYDKSDAVRKEADRAQESFIKCKVAADEEHQKHIEMIKQVHDYDKMLSGIRHRDSGGIMDMETAMAEMERRPSVERRSGKDEAKEIYERFKRGEKLSTEDIMLLQNSGYL